MQYCERFSLNERCALVKLAQLCFNTIDVSQAQDEINLVHINSTCLLNELSPSLFFIKDQSNISRNILFVRRQQFVERGTQLQSFA